MTTFLDHSGQSWKLSVTPYEYRKVKERLNCDIYDIVDRDKAQAFVMRLETDDQYLADLLCVLCEDEMAERGIDQQSFLQLLNGEVLSRGYMSFWEALTNFFRRPEHREIINQLIRFISLANQKMNEETIKELGKVNLEQLVEKYMNSVMDSQESAASIQSQETEMEPGDIACVN